MHKPSTINRFFQYARITGPKLCAIIMLDRAAAVWADIPIEFVAERRWTIVQIERWCKHAGYRLTPVKGVSR